MQLLRLADVEATPRDRLFVYSRLNAAVFALVVIGGCAALLLRASHGHWNFGYYFAGVILLFLALTHKFITARFRPSNWLVRMTDLGLYIKFRSYLNYHLPVDDLTVVYIPYQEIQSARLVRERATVPDPEGKTSTQFLRYVELELAGNTAPLESAIENELVEKPPTEKRWYGSTSSLYEDYPVRMSQPPLLRIRWQAAPGAKKFLQALRPNVAIADPVSLKQDFANMQGLSRDEQERRLRELAERGETIDAIYMARQLYGCGLKEAKTMVDGLKSKSTAGG